MKIHWLILAALAAFTIPPLVAQELKVQPTPFTAWLEFGSLSDPDATPPSLPIWLESVEIDSPKELIDGAKTTFRIRLRRFAGLNDELLLRLFFDDDELAQPVVSAWSDTGRNTFPRKTIGAELGLPNSETLLIPTAGADYIELEVAGDGSTLKSALVASVQKADTRRTLDLGAVPAVIDPFDATEPAQPSRSDAYLFGRVKATLDAKPFRLDPGELGRSAFEFALEREPLMALLTFEVLNVNIATPPEVAVNGRIFGPATLILPDLADPAFTGKVHAGQRDVQFRYTGWIKCQMMIPGTYLNPGDNVVTLENAPAAGSVAVRSVEVQLKYESELSPVQ